MKNLASKYTAVQLILVEKQPMKMWLIWVDWNYHQKKHVSLTFGRISPSSELSWRAAWNVSWLQLDSSQLLWYKMTMAITSFWLVKVLSPKSLPGVVEFKLLKYSNCYLHYTIVCNMLIIVVSVRMRYCLINNKKYLCKVPPIQSE